MDNHSGMCGASVKVEGNEKAVLIKEEPELDLSCDEGVGWALSVCEDGAGYSEVTGKEDVLLHTLPGASKMQTGGNSFQSHGTTAYSRAGAKEEPFNCSCGKSFIFSYDLKRHSRTHSGKKPFHCPECGKNFSQSYHLKRHSMIHSGEKPFHCLECGKSFSESSSLKAHLEELQPMFHLK